METEQAELISGHRIMEIAWLWKEQPEGKNGKRANYCHCYTGESSSTVLLHNRMNAGNNNIILYTYIKYLYMHHIARNDCKVLTKRKWY